jgi:tRNA A-37 threonylcarbamoyl transferase component Bud32/tetratricopeptide (TPR) repeat protein
VDVADRLRAALAGRYELEREVGRGGMAVVYLSRDLKHDRRVAVKVMRPELAASLATDRFLREIHIAAELQHPLIVPLYDSGGTEDGLLWYVMPFVEGETLRSRLKRENQLLLEDALRIAHDAAEALAWAHSHGIVHRDIKPENILLAGERALVADFGLARALTQAAGGATSSGVAVGTPAYMSPEQGAGGTAVDARSDIYSLGCVIYEMLAGEPPFTGPTPQVIIARHVSEHVPSLAVARPNLPAAVKEVIERSLAKAAADRFSTAQAFSQALERAAQPGSRPASWARRRMRRALGAAAVLAVAIAVWRGITPRPHALDASRVIVFPFAVSGGQGWGARFGEDVGTALFTALNFTGSLVASDGWRLLDQRQRDNPRLLDEADTRRASDRTRARFVVDGVLLLGDSVRGVIHLHDAVGDSVSQTPIVQPAGADAWTVGLQAAIAVLPRLIPAGQHVDLRALSDRSPAAVAQFLKGEQAYRRAKFREALGHYTNAVAADSAFALAALHGAWAASWEWIREYDAAGRFIRVTLAHLSALSKRDHFLAGGFGAYLRGRADSALSMFRQAYDRDRRDPQVTMLLGEVYTHLLPDAQPLDSLAEAAFAETLRLDSTFGPVLYHLTENALRRGDVPKASSLFRDFTQAEPDSAERAPLEVMLKCVRDSPDHVNWRHLVVSELHWVVDAGRALAVAGLRQPRCAEAAWRAVLAYDTTMGDVWRWGALSGLQALLVAEGRTEALRELIDGTTDLSPDLQARLYIQSALAGAPVEAEAEHAAGDLARAYARDPAPAGGGSSPALWYLGTWQAHRGQWVQAQVIADTLARRGNGAGGREEALMARSIAARATLARGDSAKALILLSALAPDTNRSPLTWNPWESLGGERMLLAQLRFARGEYAESYRVATDFDAPDPVPYVMYVAASLALRMRAAEQLGDRAAAEAMGRRLQALGRGDLVQIK